MSKQTPPPRRLSITDIVAMKGKTPIVSLTAYTAPMAALLDEHIDLFIVGDSLGMVLYGLPSTLQVDMAMMVRHGRAVVDHSSKACVVVDMPFGSYQASKAPAFDNASRLLSETGCNAVKLEGGNEMVDTVHFLVERGIPVMAHIGLKPQHVQQMGGYKWQGKTPQTQQALKDQAKAFEQAGAFSLLLEGTHEATAAEITEAATIPTIGIGASPQCDGQVVVTEDMLGLFDTTPKFVKRYGALREDIHHAAGAYAKDVRSRSFPENAHCFGVEKDKD